MYSQCSEERPAHFKASIPSSLLLFLDDKDCGLDSKAKAVTTGQVKIQDPKAGTKSESHIEVLVIRPF